MDTENSKYCILVYASALHPRGRTALRWALELQSQPIELVVAFASLGVDHLHVCSAKKTWLELQASARAKVGFLVCRTSAEEYGLLLPAFVSHQDEEGSPCRLLNHFEVTSLQDIAQHVIDCNQVLQA